MRAATIDSDMVRDLAAARGIDTVRELAEQAGISEWVLYKGLQRGHLLPSHAIAVAKALDVEGPSAIARRTEVPSL